MKKVILTLLASLLCIMLAKADIIHENENIIDTLQQRVINGLTVIPIRSTSIPLKAYPERATNVFWMSDNVFQALSSLPENTMKKLYADLSKESCEIIKQIEFQDWDEFTPGKEYIRLKMHWFVYDKFGIFNGRKAVEALNKELEQSK